MRPYVVQGGVALIGDALSGELGVGGELDPAVGTGVNFRRHGGAGGRHGDRTVEGSTAFPGIHQLLALVVVHAPHLEMDPDVVIEGDVRRGLF